MTPDTPGPQVSVPPGPPWALALVVNTTHHLLRLRVANMNAPMQNLAISLGVMQRIIILLFKFFFLTSYTCTCQSPERSHSTTPRSSTTSG